MAGSTRRRRYVRRNENAVFVNLTAFILILIIGFLSYNSIGRINPSISEKDISEMKIPYSTVESLYVLTADNDQIDFGEVLAVYMLKNNFFPTKKEPESFDSLKNFVSGFVAAKKKYSQKDVDGYAELFNGILGEMKVFPVRDPHGPSGYIYGDSYGLKREGEWHLASDIVDRENIPGRLEGLAISNGTITRAGLSADHGYFVEVEALSGITFFYSNLESLGQNTVKGGRVTAGDALGLVGYPSDNVEGYPVRLHLEIHADFGGEKININPYIFLRFIEK